MVEVTTDKGKGRLLGRCAQIGLDLGVQLLDRLKICHHDKVKRARSPRDREGRKHGVRLSALRYSVDEDIHVIGGLWNQPSEWNDRRKVMFCCGQKFTAHSWILEVGISTVLDNNGRSVARPCKDISFRFCNATKNRPVSQYLGTERIKQKEWSERDQSHNFGTEVTALRS